MDNIDYVFKVIIVGDTGVGKSNVLLRYRSNLFDAFMKNTIGVDFYQIDKKMPGGSMVTNIETPTECSS